MPRTSLANRDTLPDEEAARQRGRGRSACGRACGGSAHRPAVCGCAQQPAVRAVPKGALCGKAERTSALLLTQPQAKSRVEIDQRFSGIFSDPKFKRQTVVDKRGRATGAKCVGLRRRLLGASAHPSLVGSGSAPTTCDASTAFQKKTLPELRRELSRRWLLFSCAQAAVPIPPQDAAPQDDDDDDDASASDLSEEQGAAPALAREGARRGIRGSVSVSSSSSDEGDAHSRVYLRTLRLLLTVARRGVYALLADDESDEEGSGEEGVLAQFVSGEEDVPLIDATYRLAVVDLEWDRMRAVDIFAVRRRVVGCRA